MASIARVTGIKKSNGKNLRRRQKQRRAKILCVLKEEMKNVPVNELMAGPPPILVYESLDDGIAYFQSLVRELQRRKEEEMKKHIFEQERIERSKKNEKNPFMEIWFTVDEDTGTDYKMEIQELRKPCGDLSLEWVRIYGTDSLVVRYDWIADGSVDHLFLSPDEEDEENDDLMGHLWDRCNISDSDDDTEKMRARKVRHRENLITGERNRERKREKNIRERVSRFIDIVKSMS